MQEETIYQYYLRKKNATWKDKLRDDLIKTINDDKTNFIFSTIAEDIDYKRIDQANDYRYDLTKFELISPYYMEVAKYVEEQGLKYWLDISCRNYANTTYYEKSGVFRIYWT